MSMTEKTLGTAG